MYEDLIKTELPEQCFGGIHKITIKVSTNVFGVWCLNTYLM